MSLAVLIIVSSVAAFHVVGEDRKCHPGYHLESDGVNCYPCVPDTYMPDKDHRHTTCWPCDRVRPGDWQEVVWPCTWTTNTIIECNRTHAFRFRGTCKPCTHCEDGEVETRSCSEDRDRECQPSSSMQTPTPTADVVDGGRDVGRLDLPVTTIPENPSGDGGIHVEKGDHQVIPPKNGGGCACSKCNCSSWRFFRQFSDSYEIYVFSFIVFAVEAMGICYHHKIYSICKAWCCKLCNSTQDQNPAGIGVDTVSNPVDNRLLQSNDTGIDVGE